MKKGELIISLALAGLVLTLFIMVQQKWQAPNLKEVASSAEAYILRKAGVRGRLPELRGYTKIRIYDLNREFRAVLYRSSVITLGFASGRLAIYNTLGQPRYSLDTLEGARDAWTAIYDFAGHHGLPAAGGPPEPLYFRDLTGDGKPDLVVGQYSGGSKCCTIATVLELDKGSFQTIGRIQGLSAWPFEGLEVRRLARGPAWELVAHRPQTTSCGSRDDAADVISVYAFADGQYTDQTTKFADYLQGVLKEDLVRWSREKDPPLSLLQTIAALYGELGQTDGATKFVADNLARFAPSMQQQGIDPKVCEDDLGSLVASLANPSS